MGETAEIIKDIKARNPNRTGDTLEDLGRKDLDNFEHVLRQCNQHCFGTLKEVQKFLGVVNTAILKKFGLDMDVVVKTHLRNKPKNKWPRLFERDIPRSVDRLKALHKIHIERRRHDNPEDQWQDGIYYFKNGEIAYVVLEPRKNKLSLNIQTRYSVYTNFTVGS